MLAGGEKDGFRASRQAGLADRSDHAAFRSVAARFLAWRLVLRDRLPPAHSSAHSRSVHLSLHPPLPTAAPAPSSSRNSPHSPVRRRWPAPTAPPYLKDGIGGPRLLCNAEPREGMGVLALLQRTFSRRDGRDEDTVRCGPPGGLRRRAGQSGCREIGVGFRCRQAPGGDIRLFTMWAA